MGSGDEEVRALVIIATLVGLALIVFGGWYALRRRKDVMNYHDLDEVRINRHRDGGV